MCHVNEKFDLEHFHKLSHSPLTKGTFGTIKTIKADLSAIQKYKLNQHRFPTGVRVRIPVMFCSIRKILYYLISFCPNSYPYSFFCLYSHKITIMSFRCKFFLHERPLPCIDMKRRYKSEHRW